MPVDRRVLLKVVDELRTHLLARTPAQNRKRGVAIEPRRRRRFVVAEHQGLFGSREPRVGTERNFAQTI
jgi:hypothetical protein